MAKVSKAKMKWALGGFQLLLNLLRSANDSTGRFNELIEQVKVAEEALTYFSARKVKEPKEEKEVKKEAPKEKEIPPEERKVEDPIIVGGGSVKALRPSDVGIVPKNHLGGKVSRGI